LDDLIRQAAALARSNPQQWSAFVQAFHAYTTQNFTNLIQSTLEELPRNQGRAQIAALLLDTLANCNEREAKLHERKKQ
jgi:hypothetical protein